MPNNISDSVFNFEALLFSGAMLFAILVFHAFYTYSVENCYEKITDRLIVTKRFGWLRIIFYVMAFILTLSHLVEIYIWGYVINFSGLVPSVHQAMIFAGSAYTTVGYGSNPLPLNWDLVMVVIALSGMVTFGWSISVLVSMTQHVRVAREREKQK